VGALSGPTLLDLPHRVARRLAAEDRPVYLLVNPVEYHGPHLKPRPLGGPSCSCS
jgi:hypothetical protein